MLKYALCQLVFFTVNFAFFIVNFSAHVKVISLCRAPCHIHIHINLKQELKTVKINSEKHTQIYGMYRAV